MADISSNLQAAPELIVDHWFNSRGPVTLAVLRGRPVLLHTFHMLCPGCVSTAIPQVQRVASLFRDTDLAVLGLHTVFEHHAAMTPVALEAFIHEYRITFPIGVDRPSVNGAVPETMARYGFRGTPSMVLIDRDGFVRHHGFGAEDDIALGFRIGALLAGVARSEPRLDSGEDIVRDCVDGVCATPATGPTPPKSEMMIKTLPALLIAMTALAPLPAPAGSRPRPAAASSVPAILVEAPLRDAESGDRGFVRLSGSAGHLSLSVTANGLTPGQHGMHVHAVGRCEGPTFASAGAHLNPDMLQHGHANPMGPHRGDLPELSVGPDGRGAAVFPIAANLAEVLDADGSALIVHPSPTTRRPIRAVTVARASTAPRSRSSISQKAKSATVVFAGQAAGVSIERAMRPMYVSMPSWGLRPIIRDWR